jgi:predicted amidohydrolase
MRFAAVQFDIAWENKPANHATIEWMLDAAKIEPGTFVVLPELGDTGFSFNLDHVVDDESLAWGRRLAQARGMWMQVGFAKRCQTPCSGPPGRNCAAIISPAGEVVGEYQKMHPFSYGKESQHFSGGDHLVIADCGGLHICPLICYDLRFPELWRLAAVAGAEVFTIGASWPEARQHHWRSLLMARAIENQAFVIGVNRIGRDPHLGYAGGSMIVSPMGEVIAEADSSAAALSAEIDPEAVRQWRRQFPALADLKRGLLGSVRINAPIVPRSEGP